MKFLIIRFSSIGDIVLTSPVIRCLKKQVAGAEVHFLTKAQFRPLVEHNPYIDKHYFLSHSYELMIEVLKPERYDYIIDLHHNIRTLKIKRALGVKSFSFYKLNIEKYFYTGLKINRLPDKHIVDRYLKTVESFGVQNDGEGLDYFIDEKDEIKKEDLPVSHWAGYIAAAIGAGHATKRWPLQHWKEFCAQFNHPLVLLGGKEDRERGNEIAAADPVKIYNACGKFSINESADIIRRAKLVISHDTGMMHIAAAYKKPIVSLWGNTVPAFGMYPYYGENYLSAQAQLPYDILEIKVLRCRPCSKLGYDKCPRGHFKCMENIGVDEVVSKAHARL